MKNYLKHTWNHIGAEGKKFAIWLVLALVIGVLSGSASALFLVSLDYVTQLREQNRQLIWYLPLAGFAIGAAYHYLSGAAAKGNNLLIDEFHTLNQKVPLRMFPMILVTTLLTHLCGGSAGREGTAVQMGGSIADQFSRFFGLKSDLRKAILIMGISGGFASVFGTPLAGTIFALEVMLTGRVYAQYLIPSILAAYIADYTCTTWQVGHTHYYVYEVAPFNTANFVWISTASVAFGLAAFVFTQLGHGISAIFARYITYPPLRPFVGGVMLSLLIILTHEHKALGLGIPVIVDAFLHTQAPWEFLKKIAYTALTLGSGFKGGEVTPLFYIGATLGSSLSEVIPLSTSLLAAAGFVAVFAAASNTPIACIIMGIELFGTQALPYLAVACVIAYFVSGKSSIYTAQRRE